MSQTSKYVTQGYAAQLCPRAQPGTFYGRWRFAKKRVQYIEGIITTLYLWYIILDICDKVRMNQYMTFMIEVLICLFRYVYI